MARTTEIHVKRFTSEPILKVRNLSKRFGDLEVLKGVGLNVRKGEVIFIIGPSGSGKSTFLRTLNFLEKPNSGTIEFNGERLCDGSSDNFKIEPEKRLRQYRIGVPMVFQHFNLFKHLTVLGNVIAGPVHVQGRDRAEASDAAMKILKQVGLQDKHGSYPAELSGGQQQRVGIARALAMKPNMILFDEPTSALDPELVSSILDDIRKLAAEGMTMIIVTHEMNFARRLGDTIYFVDNGEIVASGPPSEVFGSISNTRLQTFLKSSEH